MADSKKYDGSQWEHSLRKLTTATEAVKNPLYSDGTAITAYTIKGNTVQNGTPTPSAPISVNGVGTLDNGQYKIPISSGGVTTNIYLSEPLYKIGDYADTIAADGTVTRVIKTYKITGQENWGVHGSIASWFFVDNIVYPIIPTDVTLTSPTITSHFKVRAYANAISISNGECTFGHPSGILTQFRTILKNTDYTTVEDFTDWLKAQYNNGNPVTIWYASDTPTTETTTAPSIPTTEGANSITVDTTVQPSEFTATWTGWHDATVKEKSANYLDENDFGLVEVAAETYRVGTDVGVLPSGKYTFNAVKSSSAVQIYRTTKNGSTYNYETITNLPYTFTADGVSNQIFRSAGNTGSSWADLGYTNVMLNTGETAQTYEPYWQ